ncbi:DHS-like NAD/FAD-binding domain-containing protein, partial [Cantharellus anzutake]|uniref:DHS-like NAD/FAD-binding domain-containing protein n=1 Tax=Cantharellus anzutake TaxID=1750568 RepID=UPI001905C8BA
MTVSFQTSDIGDPGPYPAFVDARGPAGVGDVQNVAKAIAEAKRIVVVCGAGVSVAAGIPDFRSSEGLFRTLKAGNPKELLTSGKDLFDASVFNTPQTTSLFYKMIAELSSMSSTAHPTAFHEFVKLLDDRGQLLRLYTQNIDNIEEKVGLSCGVPHWETQKRSHSSPTKTPKKQPPPATSPFVSPTPSVQSENLSDSGTATNESPTPTPTPAPAEPQCVIPPRCIPLHGTLKYLTCRRCSHHMPLQEHVGILRQGASIACPQCAALNSVRRMVGKRDRGVGTMRPSVVLYGEVHQDGEGVGECVRRDLLGLGDSSTPRAKSSAKPDLLIVAGSSLKVPGTRRIVREFAKAVQANRSSSRQSDKFSAHSPRNSPSSRSSHPRTVRAGNKDPDQHPATIYLNLDFPLPSREWDGVFDVWLQGDVQSVIPHFVEALHQKDAEKVTGSSRKRRKAPD